MTRTASSVWEAISALARRRRLAATITLASLGLAAAISAQAVTAGSAAAVTWRPTATQADQVITVALLEASSTIPSVTGGPVTPFTMPLSKARSLISRASKAVSWPTTVSSVSFVGSYRQAAQRFLGGDKVSDNRAVLVLRMIGRFSVLISAPKGATPYATGTVLTAVLDARTGQVLDFGLANSANPLSNGIVIFNR
jgi:hypothetical protein